MFRFEFVFPCEPRLSLPVGGLDLWLATTRHLRPSADWTLGVANTWCGGVLASLCAVASKARMLLPHNTSRSTNRTARSNCRSTTIFDQPIRKSVRNRQCGITIPIYGTEPDAFLVHAVQLQVGLLPDAPHVVMLLDP